MALPRGCSPHQPSVTMVFLAALAPGAPPLPEIEAAAAMAPTPRALPAPARRRHGLPRRPVSSVSRPAAALALYGLDACLNFADSAWRMLPAVAVGLSGFGSAREVKDAVVAFQQLRAPVASYSSLLPAEKDVVQGSSTPVSLAIVAIQQLRAPVASSLAAEKDVVHGSLTPTALFYIPGLLLHGRGASAIRTRRHCYNSEVALLKRGDVDAGLLLHKGTSAATRERRICYNGEAALL